MTKKRWLTRSAGLYSLLLAGIFCVALAGCKTQTTIVEPVKEVPDHHDDHHHPPPPPPPPPHRDGRP